jgi:hypothetical protein
MRFRLSAGWLAFLRNKGCTRLVFLIHERAGPTLMPENDGRSNSSEGHLMKTDEPNLCTLHYALCRCCV